MAKWIVLVETKCADPNREDEFNEWYNHTHLPDVLETPGTVRATRYERLDPAAGQSRYLAIYEVEADDINAALKLSEQNMQKKAEAGRVSPLMNITSMGSFKQLYQLSS